MIYKTCLALSVAFVLTAVSPLMDTVPVVCRAFFYLAHLAVLVGAFFGPSEHTETDSKRQITELKARITELENKLNEKGDD